MKETGIIMSGRHPIDILERRKTMTRRTWGLKEINKHPDAWELVAVFQDGLARFSTHDGSQELTVKCPYGGYGDRLRVKETWVEAFNRTTDKESEVPLYKADIDPAFHKSYDWKPSIFMPRWASRILLEIKEIRAERLNCITEEDAMAEGCRNQVLSNFYPNFDIAIVPASIKFAELWDSLNAKRGYGWEVNPWVWVIAFKRFERA